MKLINRKHYSLWYIPLFLFFATIFYSCRKVDTIAPSANVTERFFQMPANASPQIKRILEDLTIKNKQHPFVEQFVARYGYPKWQYAKILHSKKSSSNYFAMEIESAEIVEIPIVMDVAKYVNALLNVKMDAELLYKMFLAEDVINYGFDKSVDRPYFNAEDMLLKIMDYETAIWNEKYYQIKDNRFFDYWPTGIPKPAVFEVQIEKIGTARWVYYICDEGTTSPGYQAADHPDAGGAKWVPTICITFLPDVPAIPWNNDDPTGGGNSGWTNTPAGGAGSGGGGGGNGGMPHETPCTGQPWARLQYSVTAHGWFNPCLQGWLGSNLGNNLVDENGFYLSRIEELKNLLAQNPFGLEPCDEINKIAAFGNMYREVASLQVPQSILERFQNINSGYNLLTGNPLFTPLQVQTLEDATGTIVNTDFFPVKIDRLPTGFTASSLLEYFRVHMNEFTSGQATFEPLVVNVGSQPVGDHFIDETYSFNSPYQNSIGTIIHIDLPNDGTVVESDYSQNFTLGRETHSFTFTTVKSMLDATHPVSGNRRMGIYNYTGSDPLRQGEITFYTMGVDRITNPWFAFANSLGSGDGMIFTGADRLWRAMQENMISFISANGGVADYYEPREYKPRANWQDVKDFLMKKIDLAELKRKMGC